MFLNISKFTKAIKSAYNSTGIKLGDINGGLVITSGYWLVWMEREHVPNKIKAVIMELTGELPEQCAIYEVSKNNPDMQLVLDNSIDNCIAEVKDADKKIIVTPLVIDTNFSESRLMQYAINGQVFGIREDLFQIIDKSQIDLDIEGEPTGPCCMLQNGLVYWHNQICTVAIAPKIPKQSDLLEAISTYKFEDERK